MFHQSRHSIRVPRSRSQLALSDYSALDDFSNDTLGRKPHPKWWKNDLSNDLLTQAVGCPAVVAGCVTAGQVHVTSRQVSGEEWEYPVSHRRADPEWQRNAKKFHDGASQREDL
jgi:hypothetical protein